MLTALAAAAVPVVMTPHNYRLVCANANLFRDGHVCEDCVGSHPWHGVRPSLLPGVNGRIDPRGRHPSQSWTILYLGRLETVYAEGTMP